jgi:hypothetical protein
MKSSVFAGFFALVAACCLVIPRACADGPDFNKQVRPILARYCFKCHGPDKTTRKARLRLDVEADAHKEVIVPGQPEKSELVHRILAKDAADIMPPPSTKTELTAEQKDILQKWIKSGAKFEQHWAFAPPQRPPMPVVKTKNWPKNPIDYFILAKLEANGLQPSPQADRYTLLRRLSLDLIGLPPTPEEMDAFLQDDSPDAYEKQVDRLLASPHYGERWARRWLDLARYADTNGYEKDRPRIIWPYRDWVIKALNDDMPFDRFTIEQIAGDLLPNPRPDQIIATGFHRNTMINEEGGVDPLEFRYYAVVDRVNTTGTTWLGLTMGCAQCHTHKYDPIPQREYYQMLALLNNADEPDYQIPDAAITKKRDDIQREIIALVDELAAKFPGGDAALKKSFAAWNQRESDQAVPWTILQPTSMKSNMAYLQVLPDSSILAGGDQTKSDTYDLTFSAPIKGVTAIRLEALPDDSLPGHGPGRTYYEGKKGDFFLSEFSVQVNGQTMPFRAASHDHANGAFGAGKVGAEFCYDGKPGTGWSTTDRPAQPHAAVFNFARPVDFDGGVSMQMLFERHYSCGLGRFRIAVATDARHAKATAHGVAIEAILAKPEQDRTAAEKAQLFRRFLDLAPELAAARKDIDKLRATLPDYQTTMVMQERPAKYPRPTQVHHRGEYLSPREAVEPGVLSVLNPLPATAAKNRLGLAQWLVAPDNPLTARVTINRQWQAFFGTGIVATSGDFGIQGDYPTHPQLLDWLAVEFKSPSPSGGAAAKAWSLKRMHKLIVMSATYQQSSRITPDLLAKDPDNRLLARGPRFRLEAELIRDSLLRASGLLSKKMGGPSVFPPQPSSVTQEGVYGPIKWVVSQGEDRYRRGLYTFLKRSIPYAMFSTFDGATGDECLAKRDVSNTPLQALTMLNDPVVIEAAQTLGKSIATMPGSDEQRLTELFRRCLTRPPTKEEQTVLLAYYQQQRQRLERKELDAATIAGAGGADALPRAAWTLVARAVLNLDEMVTKE